VKVDGAAAMGPGEGRAEAAGGIVLHEHPRDVALDERRTGRERRRNALDVPGEMVVDESAQLDGAQPAAPVDLALGGGYFFAAFRVP
jgi:hypothetical protein